MCFYSERYSDFFHFGEFKGRSITKNYIDYKCLPDENAACMTSNQTAKECVSFLLPYRTFQLFKTQISEWLYRSKRGI